jgi:XTP/dITP diphosphohydrolase
LGARGALGLPRRSAQREGGCGMELLIATTNPNKIKEIAAILSGLPITLKTLRDFHPVDVPDESGTTFEANAREKALHYANATGCLTIAEDSGFEVEQLGGQPGIHSARYLRPDASYLERFSEIYKQLRARSTPSSAARFVCALAMADRTGIVFETTGSVDGCLASEPVGDEGFGYDPIFYFPQYGKTFGQVSQEQKTAVSHRGKAIRALRHHLERTSRTFRT